MWEMNQAKPSCRSLPPVKSRVNTTLNQVFSIITLTILQQMNSVLEQTVTFCCNIYVYILLLYTLIAFNVITVRK